MSVPVEISEWKPAPFDVAGEQVFAIGDVHGCRAELRALFDTVYRIPRTDVRSRRRLLYLGDLIDRGPDTIGVLRLWSEDEAARGVDRIDRLMGNHEQLLMLAISGGPHAATAKSRWLGESAGGGVFLAEMQAAAGHDQSLGPSLLAKALGEAIVLRLSEMRSHATIGNTLFVHGGLDACADRDEFLARPWTSYTDARWAWISQGFLDWREGFGGTLVVHGHTPPAKHFPLTGQQDPHLFMQGRLGLDGGSARTGIVTAAEIRDGCYRILKAGARK